MVLILTILGMVTPSIVIASQFTHYFELRKSAHANYIYTAPDVKNKNHFKIRPGQILKADLTADQVKIKIKRETNNKPYWIKLSSEQGWIRYHWNQFIQEPATYGSLELELTTQNKENVMTLFHKPGFVSWRSCSDRPDLCVAFPTRSAKFELVNSELFKVKNKILLFYKIDYSYSLQERKHSGTGWAWSGYFRRKPSLPEYRESLVAGIDSIDQTGLGLMGKLKKRTVIKSEDVQKLLQQQSQNTVKQMSVFGIESSSRFNRWMSKPPERDVASENSGQLESAMTGVLKLGVDFHFISDIQNFTVTGNKYEGTFSQQSLRTGVGGIMPIFLDLEIMGTFFVSLPLSKNDSAAGSVSLIDFEQIFMLSTPWTMGDTPIKMGFAGNLTMYTGTPFETGYRALLGAKVATVIEAPEYFTHLMFGPVINTSATSLSNIEFVLRGGYRLSKKDPFHSWSIMSEFRSLSYKTDDELHNTSQTVFSLGVHKGF